MPSPITIQIANPYGSTAATAQAIPPATTVAGLTVTLAALLDDASNPIGSLWVASIAYTGTRPTGVWSIVLAGSGGDQFVDILPLVDNYPIYIALVTPASINAEMLDVLNVDTFAELTGPPAANSSLKDKITWMFMWARNRATQTSNQRRLFADDTTTVVSTETVSDDGTTYSKGEAS